MNINALLKAQACDNLPPEVFYDNATASIDPAVESLSGSGTTAADESECGERDPQFGVCVECMIHAPLENIYSYQIPYIKGVKRICGCDIPF